MFAAIMFVFLSWCELYGKPCFTKMAITPSIMIRFSKLNFVLKLDNKSYNYVRAINAYEYAKYAKFGNINGANIC